MKYSVRRALKKICHLDWQLAIRRLKPHQSEPPSIWCTGSPNEQWPRTGVFFPPLPGSLSSIFIPSTSPLKSVFDSPQLSGSFNVQDGGIALFPKKIMDRAAKYACFAGYPRGLILD